MKFFHFRELQKKKNHCFISRKRVIRVEHSISAAKENKSVKPKSKPKLIFLEKMRKGKTP